MIYEIKVLVKLPENDQALWYTLTQESMSPEFAVVQIYERARAAGHKIINLGQIKEL